MTNEAHVEIKEYDVTVIEPDRGIAEFTCAFEIAAEPGKELITSQRLMEKIKGILGEEFNFNK